MIQLQRAFCFSMEHEAPRGGGSQHVPSTALFPARYVPETAPTYLPTYLKSMHAPVALSEALAAPIAILGPAPRGDRALTKLRVFAKLRNITKLHMVAELRGFAEWDDVTKLNGISELGRIAEVSNLTELRRITEVCVFVRETVFCIVTIFDILPGKSAIVHLGLNRLEDVPHHRRGTVTVHRHALALHR